MGEFILEIMPYLSRMFWVARENRSEKITSTKYTEASFRELCVRYGCDPKSDTDTMLSEMRAAGNSLGEAEAEMILTPEEETAKRAEDAKERARLAEESALKLTERRRTQWYVVVEKKPNALPQAVKKGPLDELVPFLQEEYKIGGEICTDVFTEVNRRLRKLYYGQVWLQTEGSFRHSRGW